MNTSPKLLEDYAVLFLGWLKTANYAEATVTATRACLNYFMEWARLRGISEPMEVSRNVIESYQRWLFYYRKKDGKPLKITTQKGRLIQVSSFFKWLAKNNYILYNPASEIDLPHERDSLPRNILSHKEAETVINQPDIKSPFGIRDRAILETLYSTGIRRHELTALKIYDIDIDAGMIFIRKGKGNKSRRIPIGNRALSWINKYLQEVRPTLDRGKNKTRLFLIYTGHPLSLNGLGNLVRKYLLQSGITKRGACHMFRHAMATQMLEGGADIRYIQQMLGHRNLDSTQVYTKVSIQKLKEIHTQSHPARLDGIKIPHKSLP